MFIPEIQKVRNVNPFGNVKLELIMNPGDLIQEYSIIEDTFHVANHQHIIFSALLAFLIKGYITMKITVSQLRRIIREEVEKNLTESNAMPLKDGGAVNSETGEILDMDSVPPQYLDHVETNGVKYIDPNFENEWAEAVRYPEFKDMGKEKWLEIANQRKTEYFSKIKDVLGNVDLYFEGLEAPKKERFNQAFEKGIIEMPIAVKFGEEDYDLVAGNTRLSGLVKNGIDPLIWIVNISQY